MKRFLLLLLLPLFLLSLTDREFNFMRGSDAEREGLKGNVKRMYESEYRVSDTAYVSQYRPEETWTNDYNMDGNLTSRVHYVRDDTMWTTNTYGYNGKQRTWLAWERGDTIFYTYDQRGNMTEARWPPGSLYRREVYVYNNRNHLVLQLRIEDNGDTTSRVAQVNDTLRHTVRRFARHDMGDSVYTHSYMYKNGSLVSDSSWTNGRFSGSNTYTYKRTSTSLEERCTSGGKWSSTTVTRTTFVYDKKGNWTRMVRHRDGGEWFEMTFRTIDYY